MKLFTFYKNIFLRQRLFVVLAVSVFIFAISYIIPVLFLTGQIILCILFAALIIDATLLFFPHVRILGVRKTTSMLSLGDENIVELVIKSQYAIPLKIKIIDELPVQLQERNFLIKGKLLPAEKKTFIYTLRPVTRGEYFFNNINVFTSTSIGLIERRHVIAAMRMVPVYPSVIQMKKYELKIFARNVLFQGIKKVRRLGHNNEFEQIKNYVAGDDFRKINWKATGRKAELMINQYEDERSQQIYNVIDKSRTMRMPFEGMSLLDYAINTSLVMSNVALQKFDKAGLFTFSEKMGEKITAERNTQQLKKILETLYRQKTNFLDADYELMYKGIKSFIKGRSLLFLYTNFESHFSLQRALPILRKINNTHLLVVIFFENTELHAKANMDCHTMEDIYFKTIAQKFLLEKKLMVRELRKYGIQGILTKPQNLTVDTINKYLELKARGMI